MVKNVTNPPIRQPIAPPKTGGFVNIIWNNFFLSISQLFSPDSYGYQNISLSASGITGDYSISGTYLRDREFVNYTFSINPVSGSTISLEDCMISGCPDIPTNYFLNDVFSIVDGYPDEYISGAIDRNGIILIPSISATSEIIVQGHFTRNT